LLFDHQSRHADARAELPGEEPERRLSRKQSSKSPKNRLFDDVGDAGCLLRVASFFDSLR
jgi:hypothetical protein